MGRHSEKPYIEPFPRRDGHSRHSKHSSHSRSHEHSKHSRQSSRGQSHGYQDYDDAEQSSYQTPVRDSSSRHGKVHDSHEQALVLYDDGTTRNRAYDEEELWRGQKQYLENRFDVSRPHQPISMVTFTKWVRDHMKDCRTSGKVTDIARRLCLNMSDFNRYFAICAQSRMDLNMDYLYHSGIQIFHMYESIVVKYGDGSFEQNTYSPNHQTNAPQLLEDMFGRDYAIWDDLIWNLLTWINEYKTPSEG